MTDRCEPPPELRDRYGLHWLRQWPVDPVPWRWLSDMSCWCDPAISDIPDPEEMFARGWRYHAPIADPPAKPWKPGQILEGL